MAPLTFSSFLHSWLGGVKSRGVVKPGPGGSVNMNVGPVNMSAGPGSKAETMGLCVFVQDVLKCPGAPVEARVLCVEL